MSSFIKKMIRATRLHRNHSNFIISNETKLKKNQAIISIDTGSCEWAFCIKSKDFDCMSINDIYFAILRALDGKEVWGKLRRSSYLKMTEPSISTKCVHYKLSEKCVLIKSGKCPSKCTHFIKREE